MPKKKAKEQPIVVDEEAVQRVDEKAEKARLAFRKRNDLLTLDEYIDLRRMEIDKQLEKGNITEEEATMLLDKAIEEEEAKWAKKHPATKAEAEAQGAKVVKTVPANCFAPEKWPSTKDYFWNRTSHPKTNEDGTVEYVPGGLVRGDYPAYVHGSYCAQRVGKELGLMPQDNMIAVTGNYGNCWCPIFRSDDEDNIEILFYTLDRFLIPLNKTKDDPKTMDHSDNERDPGVYKRLRYNPKNAPKDQKYKSPNKAQCPNIYPFFPPQIVEKWERREEIETLVITEGEFKAMKAAMCGGNVIGICGIQMFYDTATRSVFSDVLRLVHDCNVKRIIFLQDGDCTDISKDAVNSKDTSGQPDKDLAKRPRNFMQAVQQFNKIYRAAMPKVQIWWQYVNSNGVPGSPKGLDDLLLAMPNAQQQIIEEMEDVEKPTVFFHRLDMTHERNKLQEHFFLNSVKDFYAHHKHIIDPEPEKGVPQQHHMFLWDGTLYKYNDQKHECEEILSRDMMAYKRIGTSWFKEAKMPTAGKDRNGEIIMAEVLLKWSRQNITDDYGTDVIKKLHRYDGFVNVPSHDDYRRVIRNFYNIYRPLLYQPSEEDLRTHGFPYIYSTMEHIFGTDNRGRGLKPGDEGYDADSQFDIGADYLQLLYQKPTQNLPILCLVSAERGTGKTSLLDLLQVMYNENFVAVGSEQVADKFNTLVSGRLGVGVDESATDKNKDFTEKLKRMSTEKKQTVEGKGQDAIQIDNFTKFIICSNNETRFIYASDDEVRFWVRKVPPFKPGVKVGNVKPLFEEEMPAFMAWLNQREMWYAPDDPKKIDRMYFPPEMLHTKALDNLLEAQRPRAERKMREWLKQWFIDFGKQEFIATAEKLQEAIAMTDKKFGNYDLDDLKRYIEENMHVKRVGGGHGKSTRFKFQIIFEVPSSDDDESTIPKKWWIKGNGRPYEFHAKDFLTQAEFYDVFPDERPQAKQTELDLTTEEDDEEDDDNEF